MSLSAPVKPTVPAVPPVKLKPVESSSQNISEAQPSTKKQSPEQTTEKTAITQETLPVANNTTIINKIEPNDQSKVPLLNGLENTNTSTTQAVDKQPVAQKDFSSFDIYASIVCVVLFIGGVLFFFWQRKALGNTPKIIKRQANAQQKPKSKASLPRTIIDYSTDNSKEIIDMLTSPIDIQPQNAKNKVKQEVKSNFEIRV